MPQPVSRNRGNNTDRIGPHGFFPNPIHSIARMNAKTKSLEDAAFYLDKLSGLLSQEAQRISINLDQIKINPSANNSSISEIENAVVTLNDLVIWVEDIEAQVDQVRRELAFKY